MQLLDKKNHLFVTLLRKIEMCVSPHKNLEKSLSDLFFSKLSLKTDVRDVI